MKKILLIIIYLFTIALFYSYGDLKDILMRILWLLLVSVLLFLLLRFFSWSFKRIVLLLFWFTITPWVVQQSVVISGVHWFTLLILLLVYIFLTSKRKIFFLSSLVFIILLGKLIYPQFWIYRSLALPPWDLFLTNFFNLFSFKQFFFQNIFIGKRNSIGSFYPEALPIFLLGLYRFLNSQKLKTLLIPLSPWLLIVALSNEISGGKELFVLLPFFSILFVLGGERLYRIMVNEDRGGKGSLFKAAFLIYVILLLYGILNFAHYFRVHYLAFEM